MIKKTLILIAILLFLIGCSAAPGTDKTTTSTKTDSTSVKTTVKRTPTQPLSSEVKELLAKHESIKSVKYAMDSGTAGAVTIHLKNNKIKKVNILSRYKENTYDTVYVDRTAKKAYGYCAHEEMCHENMLNKAVTLSFESENIVTPFDLIKQVTYAEIVGEEQIDNRQSMIMEHTNKKGKREKLWVDNFYGFVQKQEAYDGDNAIETHTFTDAAFNRVTDNDVSLPEGVNIE